MKAVYPKIMSQTDGLTGLYNRTYFEMEMARIEVDKTADIAIYICDVDGLKLINDSLGHSTGDHILQESASILKSCFKQDAVIARSGGDEFAVLVRNVDSLERARLYAEIYKAIALRNKRSPDFPINMSVGYAVGSSVRGGPVGVYKAADDNMYKEKLNHTQSIRRSMT